MNRKIRISFTCPCMSPHTVTGVCTGWTFGSSSKRSHTMLHNSRKSSSGRYLHRLAISIHLSTSPMIPVLIGKRRFLCFLSQKTFWKPIMTFSDTDSWCQWHCRVRLEIDLGDVSGGIDIVIFWKHRLPREGLRLFLVPRENPHEILLLKGDRGERSGIAKRSNYPSEEFVLSGPAPNCSKGGPFPLLRRRRS